MRLLWFDKTYQVRHDDLGCLEFGTSGGLASGLGRVGGDLSGSLASGGALRAFADATGDGSSSRGGSATGTTSSTLGAGSEDLVERAVEV